MFIAEAKLQFTKKIRLKLTLPVGADIPSVRDNSAYYVDDFHCNARSLLQGYAMPFLHSVSV